MNSLDIPTKVNMWLAIASTAAAVFSVIGVLITYRQNNKMIENATRPYVCIYGISIDINHPFFYLVIKNFGTSAAYMRQFESNYDFQDAYLVGNRNYLSDLSSAVLAPGQSRICVLDFESIPDQITFKIKYSSFKKIYKETLTVNLKAGSSMPRPVFNKDGEELRYISQTLFEMLKHCI